MLLRCGFARVCVALVCVLVVCCAVCCMYLLLFGLGLASLCVFVLYVGLLVLFV